MLYDSLLMNSGGGIISTTQKSEQFGGAALCIGIGIMRLLFCTLKVLIFLQCRQETNAFFTYKFTRLLTSET